MKKTHRKIKRAAYLYIMISLTIESYINVGDKLAVMYSLFEANSFSVICIHILKLLSITIPYIKLLHFEIICGQ